MQSPAVDVNTSKNIGRLLGPALGDQQQGSFSINLWKIAFHDDFARLYVVRAGGHECGCLLVLERMVMEKCVARLDVAMFNAILRESAHEIPTDPISDPIVDSKVLPILAGDLSFGSGAQLKNSVEMISPDKAAKILLEDAHDLSMVTLQLKLGGCMMNFIVKTHHPETRMPAFRWLGMRGKSQSASVNDLILETKKRTFGTELINTSFKRCSVATEYCNCSKVILQFQYFIVELYTLQRWGCLSPSFSVACLLRKNAYSNGWSRCCW